MRIPIPSIHATRNTQYGSLPRRQAGMAVICVLALIAIVLIYTAANIRTLNNLGEELKLLERQQIHRLKIAAQASPALSATNSAPENQPAHE
jgi:hypothetical protein